MNKTFITYNLGCKVNAYELSAISSLLLAKGYKEDSVNPGVVIINTCSVTATADQKVDNISAKCKRCFLMPSSQ